MENQAAKKSAAEAAVIESSKFNVFALIVYRIIGTIIGYGFAYLVSTILIPVLGIGIVLLIITSVSAILTFIENISFLFSKIKVTETGLVGRALFFKGLDVTFDQVESVSRERQKTLLVKVKNSKGKAKKYRFANVKNIDDIYNAYISQSAKAAGATVAE